MGIRETYCIVYVRSPYARQKNLPTGKINLVATEQTLLRSEAGGSSEGRHDRIDCEYGKPQQIEATVHVVKASHPVAVYRTAVIEDEGNG